MRRVIRIVFLVLLLLILVTVVWLRMTPEGREMATDATRRWQRSRHGEEERDAAAKLTALGARLVRSAPPEPYFASLNCNDLTLGDEGYQLIGKCYRLESATFIHCDLNDERIRYLIGLSDLASLNIINTPEVTDAGMKYVGSLRGLVGLILKGTKVGDAGLKQVGQLSELGTLDLSGTLITDAGLSALTGLSKLQWLLLMDTAITDDGAAKLKGLSSLRQLTLKGTKVTDKGKAELMKMYPKVTID